MPQTKQEEKPKQASLWDEQEAKDTVEPSITPPPLISPATESASDLRSYASLEQYLAGEWCQRLYLRNFT